jgi:hypothetical protein
MAACRLAKRTLRAGVFELLVLGVCTSCASIAGLDDYNFENSDELPIDSCGSTRAPDAN